MSTESELFYFNAESSGTSYIRVCLKGVEKRKRLDAVQFLYYNSSTNLQSSTRFRHIFVVQLTVSLFFHKPKSPNRTSTWPQQRPHDTHLARQHFRQFCFHLLDIRRMKNLHYSYQEIPVAQ